MMIFFFPKGSICFLIKRDRRGLKTTISSQEKEKHVRMMMTLSPGRAQKCAHHHRQKKVLLIRSKEKKDTFLFVRRKERKNFAKYTGVVRCSKQQQKKILKNSLSKRESKEAGRIPRLGSSYCNLFLSRGLSLFSSFFFSFACIFAEPTNSFASFLIIIMSTKYSLAPSLLLSLSLSLFLSLSFSLSLSFLCSALN